MLNCTEIEIAAYLGISERTLRKRLKDPACSEVVARGRAKGRISVRRAQMRLLDDGNATMAVWLGKQMLGQKDSSPAARAGGENKISIEVIDALHKRFTQNKTSR